MKLKITAIILCGAFLTLWTNLLAQTDPWMHKTYRATLTFDYYTPAVGVHTPRPSGTLALPELPAIALATGVNNNVVVIGFHVGTDGKVADVKVVSTTDPIWGTTSKKVVESWKFAPATSVRDGKPVAVDVQCRFNLSFESNPPFGMESLSRSK